MRNFRISLLALPAVARVAALAAAHKTFPGVEVVEVANITEAMSRKMTHSLELLVLADSGASSLGQAATATDESGLPRWTVIVLGRGTSELAETVPPEEWNAVLLTRIFRSALLQHELLCENLRLRGDLKTVASRLSHDLITPVACINASVGVLRIMPPDDAPSIAAIVQNIEESSAEVAQLVERVSFVVRASAGSGVVVDVDMAEVVAPVLRQLETDIRDAGATVLMPAGWPKVSGNPKWLHVIWWNLIRNGLKHHGSVARIQLEWVAVDEGFQFSVADTGVGVAPEMQSGLFRPFDQLHLMPSVGLGLSIVQRLVALQGGRCGYESLSEGGGRFHFSLPAAKT